MKNIEPYTIAGGNPAKLIKKRFSEIIIEKLLKIKWWNWDIEIISNNINIITGGDIEALKNVINKE